MLDVVEPIGRLDQRRTRSGDRIGQPGPVARGAIANVLRRQLARRGLHPRLLFGLDPLAPGRRRFAIFALERAVESRLAVEADRLADTGGGFRSLAPPIFPPPHSPPRATN